MNEFIEENKKMIILAVVLIGISILFGIINLFMSGTKSNKPEKVLKDLASIYYEDLLYPRIMEDSELSKEIIDDYKEMGIKVTLAKLLDSIENAKKDVFDNNKTYCRIYDTHVIIYPTGYEKDEYKIETYLSC